MLQKVEIKLVDFLQHESLVKMFDYLLLFTSVNPTMDSVSPTLSRDIPTLSDVLAGLLQQLASINPTSTNINPSLSNIVSGKSTSTVMTKH